MKTIPVTFSVALLAAGTAGAATFIYNETTSTTTQWAAGTSWDSVPVSATDTILTFSSDLTEGTNIVSNNDIAGNFLLNRINFQYNGTASSPSPTVTISGNPLEFSGASAQIYYNTGTVSSTTTTFRPQLIIDSDIVLSTPLTVYSNAQGPMPSVILNGAISGNNSLTFSGTPGATTGWVLSNPANSYTGDTQLTLNSTSGRSKILRLGASEVIPNGVGRGNLYFNSISEAGTLIVELNGFNETINALNSGVAPRSGGNMQNHHVVRNTSATSATFTVGDNNATGSFIGIIADGTGGGALNLTKVGSGVQSLSGGSTHTGDTSIQGGTLKIDFSNYATAKTNDPSNYFSTQSDVSLGAGTTFAIQGRGNGAATSTENVTLGAVQTFTLPNSVADQLVVGQELVFTKTGGAGTPVATSFIVTMERGATTTTVSGSVRLSNGGGSTATVDTSATIGSTSQTLASLTLAGAAATNAIIDFGDTDNVALLISSAPVQLNDGSTITLANWNGSFSGGSGDQWIFTGAPSEFSSVFSQSEVIFDGFGPGYALIDFGGTYEVVAVPEPAAYALVIALGALGLAIRRRRR